MTRPLEPNDNVLAVLISRAAQAAGVEVRWTGQAPDKRLTPYMALAMMMRDVRRQSSEPER